MCLLPALIYFQIPLSICFSSSSTAPKSSGASETWGEVQKKKSGREREKSANKTLGCLPILHHKSVRGGYRHITIPSFIPKQTNSGHATFSSCPCFPCSPLFFSFFFSSRSFLLLRFTKLCSRTFAASNNEKELQKSFWCKSTQKWRRIWSCLYKYCKTKAYQPHFPFVLLVFFPTLVKASPQYRQTGRRGVKSTNFDKRLLQPMFTDHTIFFYLIYLTVLRVHTPLQEHLAFSSNSLNCIYFSWSFNISSLCGGSWHPCVRSKPLSPVLSALSVAVSCSH